jgi:hypothetical protein
MNDVMEGGCQCGAVRYRIEGKPLDLAVCQCTECQRQSGSAFGMSLAIPAASFHLTKGALKSFQVQCDSGRTKTCMFCAHCGTRVYHPTNPAGMTVKAGTLDYTAHLVPTAHYWTKRRQPWVVIPAGARCVEDDG